MRITDTEIIDAIAERAVEMMFLRLREEIAECRAHADRMSQDGDDQADSLTEFLDNLDYLTA